MAILGSTSVAIVFNVSVRDTQGFALRPILFILQKQYTIYSNISCDRMHCLQKCIYYSLYILYGPSIFKKYADNDK